MAEENEDADHVDDAEPPPVADPVDVPPTQAPPSSRPDLRTIGIAVLASAATAVVTYGATSWSMAAGERSRAEAAQTAFDTRITSAEQQTAEVRGQLEALHQQQAVYVAHTSIVRAMQELDKSNFGSAAELLKHAGEALGAAHPAKVGKIRQTVLETPIEVGEDRIAQLNRLREIAKQLQAAMEG
ncbi:MAG: hypothetical protein AAF602_00650 [Myxococcota bacterium]